MSKDTTQLKVGILIISDTAHADPSTDKVIPILKETFERQGNSQWILEQSKIIPDDVSKIQEHITVWCDGPDYINLVVTSGGTGFAVKDQTPEAIGPLIHRHAPGLV